MMEEVGYGQADWFATKLQRHYPELHRGITTGMLTMLSREEYEKLKGLYWQGYASSDHKKEDPIAQEKLKQELIVLGIL